MRKWAGTGMDKENADGNECSSAVGSDGKSFTQLTVCHP